ncbi:MAG: hypothetical protein HY746_03360 [Elusimicrobia bacterium]|nr:hypothetical protein [Elusimicrobiota bacterium]
MDNELTLIEHVSELRRRIIISLVCLGAGTVVVFPFSSYFLHILKIPAKGAIDKFVFLVLRNLS